MTSPFVLKAQEELRSRRLVSPGTGNTGVDEDLPVDVLFLGELHRHDMTCRREVFPQLLGMGLRRCPTEEVAGVDAVLLPDVPIVFQEPPELGIGVLV